MGASGPFDSSETGKRSKSEQSRSLGGDGHNDVIATRLRGDRDSPSESLQGSRRLGKGVEG